MLQFTKRHYCLRLSRTALARVAFEALEAMQAGLLPQLLFSLFFCSFLLPLAKPPQDSSDIGFLLVTSLDTEIRECFRQE